MPVLTPYTALRDTCVLRSPSPLLNEAFRYAKDNIARCMRWYTLGWGMSNAPHASTLVVGRDTGWMTVGADYVAPWFAPEALRAFGQRQKPNGQIVEYIDLETGYVDDYGLNVADNTPLYVWGVCHHWRQHASEAFRHEFAPSVRRAAEHMLAERGPRGLLVGVPAGTSVRGITGWRNIIDGYVQAGEVTEINVLAAAALREASAFLEDPALAEAAEALTAALNQHLWSGDGYVLNHFQGRDDARPTGDAVFPVAWGAAPDDRARATLDRLSQPDFWTDRGLRTLPATHPDYHPSDGAGLLGGSWPNLTLWYARAAARFDPDRALAALEQVARPVVEPQPAVANVAPGQFPEYYHGETGANLGMRLSPWVAPTFIWAVLEGLLGLTWHNGQATFAPNWPAGWSEVTVERMPSGTGPVTTTLTR